MLFLLTKDYLLHYITSAHESLMKRRLGSHVGSRIGDDMFLNLRLERLPDYLI